MAILFRFFSWVCGIYKQFAIFFRFSNHRFLGFGFSRFLNRKSLNLRFLRFSNRPDFSRIRNVFFATFFLIFPLIFLAGCGYYPISYYSKQSLGENIYVESIATLSDPENSVIAKDALHQAIVTRFQSNLTSRENADSIIHMEISNIYMYSIVDSQSGFPSFYRMQVSIKFNYTDKNGDNKSFTNIGIYDFSVEGLSTVTDEKRFAAINQASLQAIDKFIAQVAYNWR
ncbi:LPS assembly lipoprotein LptE [Helicobacter sp. 16-1353]|uniref:LPS assembly lipoprotein LptE n=1 Tax=Helicobacter sp. 16-1353 TaxID=2004996 RepID=UPI00215B8CBA|nr:LPS assembly lipoprotein LptE [Helicobacter sp. 16-1353]